MMKLRQKNKYNEVPYKKNSKEKGSDSESGEETELFVKDKQPARIEFPTIDKILDEGDTLQSLAITYRCSIAELKRINNIHKENEIFAKRVIKVPYRPFTLALAGVHVSGNSSPERNNTQSTSRLIDIESVGTKLIDSIKSNDKEVNDIIFNSQIIQKVDEKINSDIVEGIDEETVRLLPISLNSVKESDPVISRLNCNGADADISWKVLLVCVILVIVALPLLYVFYIAEHPESFHHTHHHFNYTGSGS